MTWVLRDKTTKEAYVFMDEAPVNGKLVINDSQEWIEVSGNSDDLVDNCKAKGNVENVGKVIINDDGTIADVQAAVPLRTLADRIEVFRKANGTRLDGPVTLQELRNIESGM